MTIQPVEVRSQGQHDVLFDLVRPYGDFPREVSGPTVWRAEEFRERPGLWTKAWSEEHIKELEQAYDQFVQQDLPITLITKVCPPLNAAHVSTLSPCPLVFLLF